MLETTLTDGAIAFIVPVLLILYHAAAGMKRDGALSWEHVGQFLETTVVLLLGYLLIRDVLDIVLLAIIGNVVFQMNVNVSFGKPLIWMDEPWTWDLTFRGKSIPIPKLPHLWRVAAGIIAFGILAWRYMA